MKLLSFIHPNSGKRTWGYHQNDQVYDLGRHCPDLKTALMSNFLHDMHPVEGEFPAFPLAEITFLPVIDNPGKIFCVGMNYQDKRIEFEQTIDAPTLFVRFPDSLTAHSTELCKPESSDEFDYEGELAVIIGKHASNVSRNNALEYVHVYLLDSLNI